MEDHISINQYGAGRKNKKGCTKDDKKCVVDIDSFEKKKRRRCSHKDKYSLSGKEITLGEDLCVCNKKTGNCRIGPKFTRDYTFKSESSASTGSESVSPTEIKKKIHKTKKPKESGKVTMSIKKPSSRKQTTKTCSSKEFTCAQKEGRQRCSFVHTKSLDRAAKTKAAENCICNPSTNKCVKSSSTTGSRLIASALKEKTFHRMYPIEKGYVRTLKKLLKKSSLAAEIKDPMVQHIISEMSHKSAEIIAKRDATLSFYGKQPRKPTEKRLRRVKKQVSDLVSLEENPLKINLALNFREYLARNINIITKKFIALLKIYGIHLVDFKVFLSKNSISSLRRLNRSIQKNYKIIVKKRSGLKHVLSFVSKRCKSVLKKIDDLMADELKYKTYAIIIEDSKKKIEHRSGKIESIQTDYDESQRDFVLIQQCLIRLNHQLKDIYTFGSKTTQKVSSDITLFKYKKFVSSRLSRVKIDVRQKTASQKIDSAIDRVVGEIESGSEESHLGEQQPEQEGEQPDQQPDQQEGEHPEGEHQPEQQEGEHPEGEHPEGEHQPEHQPEQEGEHSEGEHQPEHQPEQEGEHSEGEHQPEHQPEQEGEHSEGEHQPEHQPEQGEHPAGEHSEGTIEIAEPSSEEKAAKSIAVDIKEQLDTITLFEQNAFKSASGEFQYGIQYDLLRVIENIIQKYNIIELFRVNETSTIFQEIDKKYPNNKSIVETDSGISQPFMIAHLIDFVKNQPLATFESLLSGGPDQKYSWIVKFLNLIVSSLTEIQDIIKNDFTEDALQELLKAIKFIKGMKHLLSIETAGDVRFRFKNEDMIVELKKNISIIQKIQTNFVDKVLRKKDEIEQAYEGPDGFTKQFSPESFKYVQHQGDDSSSSEDSSGEEDE